MAHSSFGSSMSASPPRISTCDGFEPSGAVPDPLFDLEIYSRLLTTVARNLVLNGLSFVERRQSGTFDGTDVYEHIFAAALRLNEPIALRRIEPFHGAGSHSGLLAESNNNSVVRSVGNSKLPPWLAAKGNGPAQRAPGSGGV